MTLEKSSGIITPRPRLQERRIQQAIPAPLACEELWVSKNLPPTELLSWKVPSAWEPVLVELADFQQLERALHASGTQQNERALLERLESIHDRLVRHTPMLLDAATLDDFTPEHDLRILTRAALVLMRLEEAIGVKGFLVDTAGSRALGRFQSDFFASDEARERLTRALRRLPYASQAMFANIEQQVEADLEDARRKQRIVTALCNEFQLQGDADQLTGNIFDFFHACFPQSGLVAGEVQIIVTGCLIFFCIPFEGTELLTPRFRGLASDEKETVRSFLKRLKQFAQWQFAHFPVFGFLRGEEMPGPLVRRIAEQSNLPWDDVCRELSRLIAVVPQQDLEKFVVHDVWGHSWQASMLHYDPLYEQLAKFADPLDWQREINVPSGGRLAWHECFCLDGLSARLHPQNFDLFVRHLTLQRMPIALTPMIAEMLADIAEHKCARDESTGETLPNSSLLSHHPSKLDLLLQDLDLYFKQATRVWQLLSSSKRHQRQMMDRLTQAGAAEASAREVIAELQRRWQAMADGPLAGRLNWKRVGDTLEINLYTRLALNLLGMHGASLNVYRRIASLSVNALPLTGFHDLMLIAAAIFFEENPQQNLWRLDEFLAFRMVPLCQQLALASAEN